MRTISLAFVVFLFVAMAGAQPLPSLMPLPASLQPGTGQLLISPSFSVAITGHTDVRLQRMVDNFLSGLRRQTGMLPVELTVDEPAQATLLIRAESASKEVQELGEDEAYSLQVTATRAQLSAVNSLGIQRGLQTLLQLVVVTPDGFAIPAVQIQDKPRFAWRGLLIDVGRHFIPLEVLKRNLDGMAAVKLNVLHWHVSDNQGFRVESKKFPKLQQLGSDGLYYTQEEIREFISYARDRGIRVVPEFDMPGHSTSWFVGYPELASAPGPYGIERRWGVHDPAMDPTQEQTYKFLDEFIGEMANLFPDRFFHIGGDEVNGKQWDANPKIQQYMRSHNLRTNEDLQAYFNKRLQAILSKHGKIMMGWDEILRPDLPKDIVVQSWRGQESLAEAAKKGYRTLLSNGYYIDLLWPASHHYLVEPISGPAATLSSEEEQRILGGEACMWGELISAENIDSRIWPRTAAIAERLWSPQEVRDVDSMYRRMDEISRRLDWLGLTHNSGYPLMLRRIAGGNDITALRTLADVVEPPKDYTRGETATVELTSLSPLNRLIDAVQPESATARRFAGTVEGLVAGSPKLGTELQIRNLLTRWRDNYAELQPLADQSFLVKELLPLSQSLSALGASGLQALSYLERGERASDTWRAEQLAIVEQANKPKAQVLLMVAPAVQRLVEAAAGHSSTVPQEQHP